MEDKKRDIVVSPWAAAAWEQATKLGYFNGKRPGAPLTREEAAIIFLRMGKICNRTEMTNA